MNHTNQNDSSTSAIVPVLDLDTIRPVLQQLARATVDKTLQQARETRTDPVLGRSSALATYYMMMPRNDGKAMEHILDIVAHHVEGLTVITSGLKFGIDPRHLDLVQSNQSAVLAQLQTDHDPDPRGPTYRPDALAINRDTGKACLLEFKRQASTIETTRLNQIADNLTIARAQVCDLLYRKHRRMKIEPEAVSWAIIDCSDQELPPRFRDIGVFGLDSLDAICGVRNVAEAYRLARTLMAAEFSRGETELMAASQKFVPAQTVNELIEAAVCEARMSRASAIAPLATAGTVDADCEDVELDDLGDPAPDGKQQNADDQATMIIQFPSDGRITRRRPGMFGT